MGWAVSKGGHIAYDADLVRIRKNCAHASQPRGPALAHLG